MPDHDRADAPAEPGPQRHRPPPVVVVAAVVVALEALAMTAFAVLDLASATSSRLGVGIGTSLFLLAYAAFQATAAVGLVRLRSRARGPVLFTQLIQLGLAWNLRGGDLPWLAPTMTIAAAVAIGGVVLPSSLRAFEAADPR